MSSARNFDSNSPPRHHLGHTYYSPGRHPSGLVRLVEASSRTRGNSAIPQPHSFITPTPDRGFQTQTRLNNIDNSLNYEPPSWGDYNSPDYWSPSSQSSSGRVQGVVLRTSLQRSNDQQSSPTPSHSFNIPRSNSPEVQPNEFQSQGSRPSLSVNMPVRRVSENSTGNMPPQMAAGQLTAQFQAAISDLQQKLARAPSIPQPTQEILNQQLFKIGRDVSESQRRSQQESEKTRAERDNIRGQLEEIRRQLNSVIQDRARISTERDTLQLRVSELGVKSKKSIERIGDVERHWKKVNDGLLERLRAQEEQLRVQEEQLKGKRALWMDANPNSASRRSAMSAIQDPFSSPPPSQNHSLGGGAWADLPGNFSPGNQDTLLKGQNVAPHFQSTYGPAPLMKFPSASTGPSGISLRSSPLCPPNPADTRRGPNFTGISPILPDRTFSSIDQVNSLRRYKSQPTESMAMVPFIEEEALCLEFKAAISNVYDLVQDWAKVHTNQPDREKDQAIARLKESLWDYMMQCLHPVSRKDAQGHVIALLEDPDTRYWFVMRMTLTYCIRHIMSVKAFKCFSQQVADAIDDANNGLQERGLANDARQILIDRQSEAVQSIVDSPRFNNFRNEQLNLHTKRLRDLLGPLLNTECARSQAGKELGTITVTAWDLSVKMYTSHLSFQVYFPDTTAKFNAATMVATDTDQDPVKLQIQQARLKLVITPVITMRDDRGTTIKVKNLRMANVVLMA